MWLPRPREVDEAVLEVGRDQLDPQLLPDPDALPALDELALDGRIEDADPGSLVRRARHDSVEALADPRLEQQRCRRLAHLTLDLLGVVLLFGAVGGERIELSIRVRRLPPGQRRFDLAMRDQVRKPAI